MVLALGLPQPVPIDVDLLQGDSRSQLTPRARCGVFACELIDVAPGECE